MTREQKSNEIIALGYDPVFVDIITTPKDPDGKNLTDLPPAGEHIPNTDIKLISGGNALNVAKMMSNLGHNTFFVAAMDTFFKNLVEKEVPKLSLISTRDQAPNYTLALHLADGEVQMNNVRYGFDVPDLSPTAYVLLALSKIVPFSNFGLNKHANNLFPHIAKFLKDFYDLIAKRDIYQAPEDALGNLIAKYTVDYDTYDLESDSFFTHCFELLVKQVKNQAVGEKVYYLDPSTLKGFNDWAWLRSFVHDHLADPVLKGHKVISVNEFEFELMKSHKLPLENIAHDTSDFYVIQHGIEQVRIWQKGVPTANPSVVDVPGLKREKIITTVGAGDVFNAGVLSAFMSNYNMESAVGNGITVVQKYLTGKTNK